MPEGVPTVGDPAAMRELARQLDARAGVISSTGNGATAPLDDAVFEGRAADRLRGSVSEARSQVSEAASKLQQVARQLLYDADEVQRQNDLLAAKAKQAEEAKAQEAKEAKEAQESAGASPTTDPAATSTTTDAGGQDA